MERICVANTYTNNTMGDVVGNWFVQNQVNIALISELGRSADELSLMGRLFYAGASKPPDSAILVRGWWRSRRAKVSHHQVTEFVKRQDKPMLWRDRWVVRCQIGKQVYYAVHANAAVGTSDGKWLANEGAEEWKGAMKWLCESAEADIKNGLHVRIGGDFNMTPNATVRYNPTNVFEYLGMHWFGDGRVMYLAWDPHNTKVVRRRVTARVPGADAHQSLTLHLKRKRTRKVPLDSGAKPGVR